MERRKNVLFFDTRTFLHLTRDKYMVKCKLKGAQLMEAILGDTDKNLVSRKVVNRVVNTW